MAASPLKLSFQASLGSSVRMADALRIASTLFTEGMAQFNRGALTEALALFEQSLSINQRYLQPSKTECVLCYNHIAAVHDKLGNLHQAYAYYERAKHQLSLNSLPKGERGVLSRRKRAELLRHVQQKLEMMPRTVQPKVGAGVPLADVRALFESLSASGDALLERGELGGARLAFEQALSLCRAHAIGTAPAAALSAQGVPGLLHAVFGGGVGEDGALAIAATLEKLAEVHSRCGEAMQAEAHVRASPPSCPRAPSPSP